MEYIQERQVELRINLSRNQISNQVATIKRNIGSHGNPVKGPFATTAVKDGKTEEETYMESYLGKSSTSPDFGEATRAFWTRIAIPVISGEKRILNTSLVWPSEEVYKQYKDAKEETLYRFARPTNLEDYIHWRHCYIHPSVSKQIDDKHAVGNFTAVLIDRLKYKAAKQLEQDLETSMMKAMTTLKDSPESTIQSYGILNAFLNTPNIFTSSEIRAFEGDLERFNRLNSIVALETIEVNDYLIALAKAKPAIFVAMVNKTVIKDINSTVESILFNFENIEILNLIYLAREKGILIKEGNLFTYQGKIITESLTEMINFFLNPNPAKEKDAVNIKSELLKLLGRDTIFSKLKVLATADANHGATAGMNNK